MNGKRSLEIERRSTSWSDTLMYASFLLVSMNSMRSEMKILLPAKALWARNFVAR